MTGRVVALVAQVVSHLGLQNAVEDGFGDLVQESVDPVDRGAGGLRIGEQRVDHGRLECLGESASRLALIVKIALLFDHVGVLPDRHVDHSGRSWSTHGLHERHDTPGTGVLRQ